MSGVAGAIASSSLRILTLNVWFLDVSWDARFAAQLALFEGSGADVICLQEVTTRFEAALQASGSPLLATHAWHGPDFAAHRYGTAALVRRSLQPAFSRAPLDSEMGRDLLLVALPSVLVGVVHLESADSADVRRQQLGDVAAALGARPSILVGDFNFCSYRNYAEMEKERRRLEGDGEEGGGGARSPPRSPAAAMPFALAGSPPPLRISKPRQERSAPRPLENLALARLLPCFVDAWPHLHPDSPGFTMDSTRNGNLDRYEQMRYDRVLFQLPPPWKLDAIEVVGAEPHAPPGAGGGAAAAPFTSPVRHPPPVWPSDHFGLLSAFSLPPPPPPAHAALPPPATCEASSTLQGNEEEYGCANMFDGRAETCWNSDGGSGGQWVEMMLAPPAASLAAVELVFQGGFVGQGMAVWAGGGGGGAEPVARFQPRDGNEAQRFVLPAPLRSVGTLRISFEGSTDFYGRVTIYRLTLLGEAQKGETGEVHNAV